MSITAGRTGSLRTSIDGTPRSVDVVAIEDEAPDGRIKIRYSGAGGGIELVACSSISWNTVRLAPQRNGAWWLSPADSPHVFLPFEMVFGIASMAERNNVALDIAYISATGEPVDVSELTVLDMGYASGAVLAQAVDTTRPIQVMRDLEELLRMAPAIVTPAYDAVLETHRYLVSIPLHQILSIRLRMPTLKELTECNCAYLLDAPNGYRKCAYCKQVEAEADLVAASP